MTSSRFPHSGVKAFVSSWGGAKHAFIFIWIYSCSRLSEIVRSENNSAQVDIHIFLLSIFMDIPVHMFLDTFIDNPVQVDFNTELYVLGIP